MIQRNVHLRDLDDFYPASDGKPVGETPAHVKNLLYVYYLLDRWFEDDPQVFAAGNMFVYYEEGNPRRHVTPDVFVVRGIPKTPDPPRQRYLLWENKSIDCVIEMTSPSTYKEDTRKKMDIYRDILGVQEYFLFDPLCQKLKPPLQGYRRVEDRFERIVPLDGRLPSEVLGLHLEQDGEWLRLYIPEQGKWITPIDKYSEYEKQTKTDLERKDREIEELKRRLAELEQGQP